MKIVHMTPVVDVFLRVIDKLRERKTGKKDSFLKIITDSIGESFRERRH